MDCGGNEEFLVVWELGQVWGNMEGVGKCAEVWRSVGGGKGRCKVCWGVMGGEGNVKGGERKCG